MPGRKPGELPEIDIELLSSQQRLIYQMAREGIRYNQIAQRLGIKISQVTSQLCRIRKKARFRESVGQNGPEAGRILNENQLVSPAEELKRKICTDPGFFSLMRKKYGSDEVLPREDALRLACTGEGKNSNTFIIKKIKILSAAGKAGQNNRVVVKLDRYQKKIAAPYLKQKKIYPVVTHWDDGSSLFVMSKEELEGLKRELCCSGQQ